MIRHVITLSGTARCGKDTVADILARNYGFQKLTWAKPLKVFCYSYYNIDPDRAEEIKDLDVGEEVFKPHSAEPIFKYAEAVVPNSITPEVRQTIETLLKDAKLSSFRQVLLFFGTKIFRETVDNTFWLQALKKFYFEHDKPEYGNIVFTDTRFPNEKEYAESLGGLDVFILKNSDFVIDHKSEKFRSEQFSYVIDNNSTLEDLERRTHELYRTIVERASLSHSGT